MYNSQVKLDLYHISRLVSKLLPGAIFHDYIKNLANDSSPATHDIRFMYQDKLWYLAWSEYADAFGGHNQAEAYIQKPDTGEPGGCGSDDDPDWVCREGDLVGCLVAFLFDLRDGRVK